MSYSYKNILKRLQEERFSLRFLCSRILLHLGVSLPIAITFNKQYCVKTYLHASSAAQKLFAGKYHPELDVAVFERYISKGDCVFDVGANIGMFTTLASRLCGEEGRVYAFEPTPATFMQMMENLKLNNVSNVLPVFGAISDTTGSVWLHDHTYSKEQNYIDFRAQSGMCVPSYRLADYTAVVPDRRVAFLKIDIEGAELLALRSLKDTIENVEVIYLEFLDCNYELFGYTKEDVRDFLLESGFALYYPELVDKTLKLIPYADISNKKEARNVIALNSRF